MVHKDIVSYETYLYRSLFRAFQTVLDPPRGSPLIDIRENKPVEPHNRKELLGTAGFLRAQTEKMQGPVMVVRNSAYPCDAVPNLKHEPPENGFPAMEST